MVCITGDNLGLNSVLDFVESFVANSSCRVCISTKEYLICQFYEENSLTRNMDQYNQQLLLNDPSKTGIKQKCIWFDLKNFHLFENVAVDFLHDYLEGVCRYVLRFVTQYLTQTVKLIPLGTLQANITYFDYGPIAHQSLSTRFVLRATKSN